MRLIPLAGVTLGIVLTSLPASAVSPTVAGDSIGGTLRDSSFLTGAASLSPERQALLARVTAALPPSAAEQARTWGTGAFDDSGVVPGVNEMVLGAIDPGDYACSPSALDQWVQNAVSTLDVDLNTLILLVFSGALDVSAYDAILAPPPATPAEYGVDGTWTTPVTHTFRDLRRFWDISSDGIQPAPAHGDVWDHPGRVRDALALRLNAPAQSVALLADALVELVHTTPALQDGRHPLFTLNAFAFTAEGDPTPGVQGLPDKIIMGDGILDIQPELAGDDDAVAVRAILAHEFGHHIQYAHGVIESGAPEAEKTRRTELMADALGTYFLVHARGGALNRSRTVDAVTNFANVGDCGFAAPQHHGTPNQRRRAAAWGGDLATSARPQGQIYASLDVIEWFDAALPGIVAPDAVLAAAH